MSSTLLVAASRLPDGQALARTGSSLDARPLLWAFTDAEALAAWDRRPAEAAIELSARELSTLEPAAGAVIAINPAGPGALLVEAETLTIPETPHPPLEERARLRRAAREADAAGRNAAQAGDLQAARESFERAAVLCEELGDRLHGAASTLELGRCLREAGLTDPSLTALTRAADVLASLGERDLALVALVEAAEAASEGGNPEAAETLSVSALELSLGNELAERIVSVWRSLDGD